ncbi:MAG: HAMP domain-containing sensor histidine kinase [Elusimicrobia bacterium]|nr:HAMP domain-containing sensor histidine kinase [Elusimicrobiota bacterium]
MKIRHKQQLITSALIMSVVVSIAAMVIHTQRKMMHSQAIQRLEALMEGTTHIAKESFDSHDRLMAVSYLMFLQKAHPELAFASISYGGHNFKIGEESRELFYLERNVLSSAGPVRYTVSLYPSASGAPQSSLQVSTGGISLQVSGSSTVKIEEPATDRGLVRFGFIRRIIDDEVNSALAPLINWTAGIAGAFLLLGLIVNAWVARLFTGPIEVLAQATGLLAAGRMDVSVPVRTNDELGTLTRSFNSMAGRLHELLESRDNILHTLTHEISAPLSGLKGYLELWQDEKIARDTKSSGEVLETMTAAVLRMENLLSNALKLFRGDAGLYSGSEVKDVPLDKIFRETMTIFMPIARTNGVKIRPLYQLTKAVTITAPEELIKQIVSNLLLNAIKYTPSGGEVNVYLTETVDEAVFHVRNTGPGIASADIPHLFTKFYRAGQDRERGGRIPGAGLGLNIVQKAVTALGGRIFVDSKIDKYTLFLVRLPKRRKAQEFKGKELL